MGNLLGRELLLVKEKPVIEKVTFDNGDFVYVRGMSGRERDTFEQSLIKKNRDSKGVVTSFEQSTEDFRAKLAVVTVCDADGNLIFFPSDYNTLSVNMSAKRLETIVNVAQKLNKISEEDKEELIKNSVVGPADNSTSDSVEN